MRNRFRDTGRYMPGTYAVCHALVDLTCAYAVAGAIRRHAVSAEAAVGIILLYDFCAFVLQPFFGMLTDRSRRPQNAAAFGCLLIGLAAFLTGAPLPAAVLMGFGNACFHVGGGTAIIRSAPQKATALGLYIAPGAVGLASGMILADRVRFFSFACLGLMSACTAAILLLCPCAGPAPPAVRRPPQTVGFGWASALVCVLPVVFIRSTIGFTTPMVWKTTAVFSLSAAAAAAAGKALGGILGDRLGYLPVAVSGLALSAVLLPFFSRYVLPAMMGIVLFNWTMPLVLAALTDLFPGRPGFAFGLNSALLFPGVLFSGRSAAPVQMAAVIIVCALLLTLSFRVLYRKKERRMSDGTASDGHYRPQFARTQSARKYAPASDFRMHTTGDRHSDRGRGIRPENPEKRVPPVPQ